MHKVTTKLRYTVDTDKFEIQSDLKEDRISEVLSDYLRSQMGTGSNGNQTRNELPVYEIVLTLNLLEDTYTVTSNTGNTSLTIGLIAHFLSK